MHKYFFFTVLFCVFSALQAQDANLIDITTLDQLDAMRYDLNGDGTVDDAANATTYSTAFGTPSCAGSCTGYELMNTLDFAGTKWENPTSGTFDGTRVTGGWEPIGDKSNQFTTTFKGNDNTIFNIYIKRKSPEEHYIGLFGFAGADAEISGVGIEGGSVEGKPNPGGFEPQNESVGCLVGQNNGTISFCYATGNAILGAAGGLVGRNKGTIIFCYATGNVDMEDSFHGRAGGLVGRNTGKISACYATGNATGNKTSNIGGLVGENTGKISACYATGNAIGVSRIGGLVGWNPSGGKINACYATGGTSANPSGSTRPLVGGLVGSNGGTIRTCYSVGNQILLTANTNSNDNAIQNSYFDYDKAFQSSRIDHAKSTAELQSPSDYTDIYAAWNVDVDDGLSIGVKDATQPGDSAPDDVWDFGTASEYPVLKVDFNRSGGASIHEFGNQGRVATPSSTFNVPATASGNVQAYPNPASNSIRFVNLSPNHSYTYKIYTAAGLLALMGSLHGDNEVNINTLMAGQYIVVLQGEHGSELLRAPLLIE